MNTSSEILSEMSQNLATNAKSAFRECHQVLRDPGKELLVFMLTDKDRKQDKNVPYSFPVAYALKGSCMTNRHLYIMVAKLRNELHKRQIPVLCETYDGQWHKYITESPAGKPLTKMYGKEVWNNYSCLSKDKCIEQLNSVSVVEKSTLERIRGWKLNHSEGVLLPGIRIEKGIRGQLSAASENFTMHRLHSINPCTRLDLFEPIEVIDPEEIIPDMYAVKSLNDPVKRFKLVSTFRPKNTEGSIAERKQSRKKRVIGLQENEESILDILNVNESPDEDLENANVDVFQSVEEAVTLDTYLRRQDFPLIPNILNELVNFNKLKWQDKTFEDLYPNILTDGPTLAKMTTVKELQIIAAEMRCCTGRIWHSSNMVKCKIVNAIIKGFGGSNEEAFDKRRTRKSFNPESLVQLCVAHLKQEMFPVEHLQIPLATEEQLKIAKNWHTEATVKSTATIPPQENSTQRRTMDFFSYPAHNEERNELQFKTFDFTHILTNLRSQILTRGLDYCRKEHFQHLSEHRPDILSLALVVDKIDQQNAFTAMRMFNYNVEKYMRDNGFEETAEFVQLV